MRKYIKKWLGINDLEEKVNETSQVVYANAKAIGSDINTLMEAYNGFNTNIALFDGRIREMELAMSLLSTAEVAEILGVSTRTVRRYCTEGDIVAKQVGGQWIVTELELKRYQSRLEKENDKGV